MGRSTSWFRSSLIPLARAADGLGELRESTYVAYCRGLGEAGASLPPRFSDTVAAVAAFVDPVLSGLEADAAWNPAERGWSLEAPMTVLGSTESGTDGPHL